jgi:hypothetical protein
MADRDGDASYFAMAMRTNSPEAAAKDRAREIHMDIIESYVTAWQAGEMTLEQKRRAISDENRAYYGPGVRRALTWP